MISDNEIAKIREYLPEYLSLKGINFIKNFRCLNPEHDDHNPSMSLDRENMQCHCFGCGAKYDIFDLIGIDYGITNFSEQYQKACELLDIEPEQEPEMIIPETKHTAQPVKQTAVQIDEQKDYSQLIRRCAMQLDESPAVEYLKSRGISPETAARYAIGYEPAFRSSTGETWQALVIPTGDMQHNVTVRNLDPDAGSKNRYEKRGSAALFNAKAITEQSDKPLFIAEGELDALSIIEVGGAAIGLGSSDNAEKYADDYERIPSDRLIIIALDNDEAGEKATQKLAKILTDKNKRFSIFNPYGSKAKDANEALQIYPDIFKEMIIHVQEAIERDYRAANSAKGLMPGFLDFVYQGKFNKPISTGFPKFDRAIDGGLYAGLYVLGAISSLGKTTFVLQIADQIAASGRDVMIFSLEMSARELIAKSISRNTVQIAMEQTGRRDYAKSMRDIMDGSRYDNFSDKEKKRIAEGIQRYKTYADRVIIHEAVGRMSVDDIHKEIEKHKFFTGSYPVVFIDYLQIIKPDNDRMTDKQAVDANITELKQLARDMPIIAVSSMNRESYKTGSKGTANGGQVSVTDFKESGNIDFGADIIIGLQFASAGTLEENANGKTVSAYDERYEKQKDPREITAVILKNRYFSVYNETRFKFIPQFNYFLEG